MNLIKYGFCFFESACMVYGSRIANFLLQQGMPKEELQQPRFSELCISEYTTVSIMANEFSTDQSSLLWADVLESYLEIFARVNASRNYSDEELTIINYAWSNLSKNSLSYCDCLAIWLKIDKELLAIYVDSHAELLKYRISSNRTNLVYRFPKNFEDSEFAGKYYILGLNNKRLTNGLPEIEEVYRSATDFGVSLLDVLFVREHRASERNSILETEGH